MLFEKSLMFMMSSTALRQRTKFWVCEFVCSDQMHHAGVCRTGKEPKVCSMTFNEEGQHPGQRKEAAPNDFQTVIDCAVSLLCVSLSLSLSPLPPQDNDAGAPGYPTCNSYSLPSFLRPAVILSVRILLPAKQMMSLVCMRLDGVIAAPVAPDKVRALLVVIDCPTPRCVPLAPGG